MIAVLSNVQVAQCTETESEGQVIGNSETLTREEWRMRVEQAKLRARAFVALAKSGRLPRPGRSAEKVAEEASTAVMTDQSLQRGDIVVTNKGLFRFDGASDADPKPGDFLPLTLDALSDLK
jgi:hypothetical protein